MRAAVLRGADISIADLPDPRPTSGEILVAPFFTGICGSDLHLRAKMKQVAEQILGSEKANLPIIVPGHEFSAEIVEIGRSTDTPFKRGDRIVPIPFAKMAHGTEALGFSADFSGGLSNLSVVIADRCFQIPDAIPSDLAALTEPLSVGRHAANLANRHRGPNLIIGCGPVGLAVLMALKADGRGPVLCADFSPERRALAEALGADIVVDPAIDSPYQHWDDLQFAATATSPLLEREFSGRPAGLNIFECVGAPGLIDQAIKNAPLHSHIIVVGVCSHADKHVPLEAILRELTLEYSFAYRPDEFAASLRLIGKQPDQVARLITSRRPLAETSLAFDTLATSPSEIKILINPRL